ncbi:NAD(P)-binding protein [Karstenula rhodostoma CBS 690.94]|uniref:NAD(P)-binding protein n=1 Tax=Karstenula rhodostoma CBS 690.94 TaxID=1392251 RepID=A0A9P4PNV4_9PLEO|nr:NAD(P)-binding protein [Karstenula rhodostoma CBS 690.94]
MDKANSKPSPKPPQEEPDAIHHSHLSRVSAMAGQTPDPDFFVKAQQFTAHTYRDVYPAIDPTNSSLSQAGKVVIITGASQGLGAKGFVQAFAATGPKAMVLVARNAKKLEEVAASVKEKFPELETLTVSTDVADPASVAALFEEVKSKFGHADVLVNNAAVFNSLAPVKDDDHKVWWSDMTVNIYGTFLVTQGFLKLLPESAPARIITLTTAAAYQVFPNLSSYGLAKLVVFELMDYVRAENPNVVAVAVHPGIVATDMLKDAFAPFAHDTPQLVGGLGTWLAAWEGPDRAFLSGRYLSANWDVDELVKRKEDIVQQDLLKLNLTGNFGEKHFK